jgi:hypothetical protein
VSRKKLDTQAVENELSGGSLFFRRGRGEETTPAVAEPVDTDASDESAQEHATVTVHPPSRDEGEESIDLAEVIRRAVRPLGKEAVSYRFTAEEHRALDQLTFSYKQSGVRTSTNELVRIAVNYLLEDHRRNGRTSLLCKVLGEPES